MSDAVVRKLAARADLPEAVVHQVLEWLIGGWSGEVEGDYVSRLGAWRSADPRHEQAWQQVQQLDGRLAALPRRLASQSLRATERGISRRNLLLSAAAITLAAGTLPAVYRSSSVQTRLADLRTGRGEMREFTLADGTRITLNTASAVDVRFNESSRRLRLLKGEIHVASAPDPLAGKAAPPRPLVVGTVDGEVRPVGTRFIVRRNGSDTAVSVLEGAVDISTTRGTDSVLRLPAGQGAVLSSGGIRRRSGSNAAADWLNGRLVVAQMPLDEFLAEVGRYRPGVLRCDADIAGLKVSGSFSVTDTDRTLRVLEQVLPVRIALVTPYWVSVTSR